MVAVTPSLDGIVTSAYRSDTFQLEVTDITGGLRLSMQILKPATRENDSGFYALFEDNVVLELKI